MGKKSILEVVTELTGMKLVSIGEGIYRGFCPFPWHNNVNTPSFTVYNLTGSYFCYGESQGGDVYNFYSKFKNCTYRQAKEALDGNVDTLVEIIETLDGIGVKDEVDYNDQANFALSKYCRDLLYRRPDLESKVMEFLKKMDKDLTTKKISAILMAELIAESRRLEIN